MQSSNLETRAVSDVIEKQIIESLSELAELQLALVAGGCAETVL